MAVGDNSRGQLDVSSWTNIVAIVARVYITVGLKADGTVVATGYNYWGQLNVSSWKNIVAIAAGSTHTVGLKEDGTVVATGNNYSGQLNVSSWTNIVAIAAGDHSTIGLKEDGTVVAVGSNGNGQLNVFTWTNIAAIAAGPYHTVGLKTDGTVVAVGYSNFFSSWMDVSSWMNITSIAAGVYHTVGLKADGTVVAVGSTYQGQNAGQLDVSSWTNIVAIAAGVMDTFGLKADGTIVAIGRNYFGELWVSSWTNITQPVCGNTRDSTPPVSTHSIIGTAGNNSWYVSNVAISLTATDAGSGVKEIHYTVDGGAEVVETGSSASVSFTMDGNHTVSYYAVDNAASSEAAHSVTVNIDKIAPTIEATTTSPPNANGWNNADVTVTFTCNDTLSGVASCPSPVAVTSEGANQIATGTAVDRAGNTATASVTLNIDKTPPSVTITGVSNGATYTLGAVPTPGYTATDNLSGVAVQSAALRGGDANNVGVYAYTVTTSDLAGNTASVTASYNVVYTFGGFLAPVSFDRPFRLGSTIPVKFQLTDASGTYISTASATITVQHFLADQPAGNPITAASTSGAVTGNTFRYSAVDNQYIYNLSTDGLSEGMWQIRATLDDGTMKTAFVSLKAN